MKHMQGSWLEAMRLASAGGVSCAAVRAGRRCSGADCAPGGRDRGAGSRRRAAGPRRAAGKPQACCSVTHVALHLHCRQVAWRLERRVVRTQTRGHSNCAVRVGYPFTPDRAGAFVLLLFTLLPHADPERVRRLVQHITLCAPLITGRCGS